jgi:hypothetical protein
MCYSEILHVTFKYQVHDTYGSNNHEVAVQTVQTIYHPYFHGSTNCPLPNLLAPLRTKPVAGSQFLGGHCRKNVTEGLG